MASGISQRLAYKGMLLKISNHLSTENLRDLKHLLGDDLPSDQLSEATQGTDIFKLLEVRGMRCNEDSGPVVPSCGDEWFTGSQSCTADQILIIMLASVYYNIQ